MSTEQIILALEFVSAAGVIALVIWLVWHRRRINRALRNFEQIDIDVDGARTQLFTAQVNNSLEHQDQTDLLKAQSEHLKTIDRRVQFLQADRIIEYEKRLQESKPREEKQADRGEMKGPTEDPK